MNIIYFVVIFMEHIVSTGTLPCLLLALSCLLFLLLLLFFSDLLFIISGPNPFMRYIGFAELAANAWSPAALESILKVVAVAPHHFSSHYSRKLDWIRVSL